MTMDDNGNDFDQELDDLDFENYKTNRQKWAEYEMRIQQEAGAKAEKKVQEQAFLEAARELGLEGSELQAAISQLDPNEASVLYKDAAKGYLKKAAVRSRGPKPRDSEGRFISNKQPPQQPQPEQKPKPKLEDFKKKAQGAYLTDTDESDILDILFPNPL